jgi:DNA-binding transcriptional ArsR family regulator
MKVVTQQKTRRESLLNFPSLRESVLTLRAVNHKGRQRILDLLDEHKFLTVTDLYIKLRWDQSLTSQHLAILRRAKAVNAVRDGKHIFYEVNHRRLAQISKITQELSN